MTSKSIILIFSVFISSVATQQDVFDFYNEFLEKVINVKEIQQQIRNIFPDTPDSVILAMLDASTKIPNGILAGSFFDLGNFDECYNIHYGNKYGKYCLGTISLNPQTEKYLKILYLNLTDINNIIQINRKTQSRLLQLGEDYIGFHFAACVPSDMAAKDIPGIQTYTEDLCYSKATEPELSTGAIIVIVILSIFGIIIVASTAYDVYLQANDKTAPHELFIAFSFLTNGCKIFKSTQNPDHLLCLNGIKAISMMWVIIGHEYPIGMNASLSNILNFLHWKENSANMFLMGATVSVDTFFVVGGLVTVYTFLKSMDRGVKFNIILYYIHRYLRLTPVLVIMCLFHLFLLNYISTGPLWKTIDIALVETCQKNWWSTILYINNYIQEGMCLPQSWYLDVDMQLYILSPIILLPLFKWPKYALGFMGILVIAGCVVPFTISYEQNLGAWLNDKTDMIKYMNIYYKKTYARFGPYVIGMIAGYFLYKIKMKNLVVRLSKFSVYTLWFIILMGLASGVWAGYPLIVATEKDIWGAAFFNGFNRPAWGVCIAGVIILCVAGYGKPIDKFLSLPVFQVLTKLSYSMYLTHYTIINVKFASLKNIIKFSNIAWMHVFWADFALTFFISIILCLSFEYPIIVLEKYLLGKSRPTETQVQEKKLACITRV